MAEVMSKALGMRVDRLCGLLVLYTVNANLTSAFKHQLSSWNGATVPASGTYWNYSKVDTFIAMVALIPVHAAFHLHKVDATV